MIITLLIIAALAAPAWLRIRPDALAGRGARHCKPGMASVRRPVIVHTGYRQTEPSPIFIQAVGRAQR